jgi:hypothetical protein
MVKKGRHESQMPAQNATQRQGINGIKAVLGLRD